MNEKIINLVAYLYKKKISTSDLEEALKEYLHNSEISLKGNKSLDQKVREAIYKIQSEFSTDMAPKESIYEIIKEAKQVDIDEAISYLIKKGIIYQPRTNQYKLIGGKQ